MKKIASIVAIIAIILVGLVSWYFMNPTPPYSEPPETITIGMEATPVNSLIYIAENQKYFQKNGLNIVIKDNYPSGSAAVRGMLINEVDVATAAELAIVSQALEQQEIQAFGSIDKFMHQYLIARRDRGISGISDIKGKVVGLPFKTGAQFNFSRFLNLNHIDEDQVFLLDVQAPEAINALISGDVDAVVAWQPNAATLKEKLGENVSIWSIQNGQPTYCALIASSVWIKKYPKLVSQFLSSLSQAEDYLIKNPDQARSIVQKRLNYSDAYMEDIWPEHQLTLSLDQSMLAAMEDEARWMINNNVTSEQEVPNFLNYIYEDGLKTIKPEAINIIR